MAIKHRQDIRDNIQRIDSNSEGDDDASYGGVECEDVKGESDEEEKQRYMKQHRQKADDERDVPALYTDQPELTCERLVLGSPGYIASIGLTRMSTFGRKARLHVAYQEPLLDEYSHERGRHTKSEARVP